MKNQRYLIHTPMGEFRSMDPTGSYLNKRGLNFLTVQRFNLVYSKDGGMKGRITFPLYDFGGNLVAYAGELVNEKAISNETPRYLFRLRGDDNKWDKFEKPFLLYNADQIQAPVDELLVVKWFPAVWGLWQLGLRNVVSCMGLDCSIKQSEIIKKLVAHGGCAWIIEGQDDASAMYTKDYWQSFHCINCFFSQHRLFKLSI